MVSIHERIENYFIKLKPSEKKAAIYIKKNWETVSIMTAKELGYRTEVSEATIHRLARNLEYNSFADMRNNIKELLVNNRALINIEFKQNIDTSDISSNHYNEELNNLKETYKLNSNEKFTEAADMILKTKKIFVIGEKLGTSVSNSIQFTLNYLLGNCQYINFSNYSEKIAYIDEDAILIVVGFQRYCGRTLKIAELCKEKGAKIISFTDCNLSPFVNISEVSFYSVVNSVAFLDSYTSVLSIVNALVNTIIDKNITEIKDNIEGIEKIYKAFNREYKW